ncbi:glycoside hydrolase family 17 protein [Myriangium duriaei CBS 260.36]|uniref:Glycoside hydrolase family 17 protein n=1 Tax=Myriangium duriaei CBS 260.36 TaxID=1168546 RepID=A0A9P4MLM5_9PEZI|nr:glycoside hydrolase family 17 protein [Myriangium duriaei CBS 260.36]
MKSIYLLSALSIASIVVATPQIHRRHRPHRNARHHAKRDNIDWVTVTSYVTEEDPSVTVYVNPQGQTISIVTDSTHNVPAQTSIASSAKTVQVAPVQISTVQTSSAKAQVAQAQPNTQMTTTKSVQTPVIGVTSAAVVLPTTATVAAASTQTAAGSSGLFQGGVANFKGIVYSPYKGNYGSTNCKTAADVMADFAKISSADYNLVRLYGVDCNQVANVAAAAKAKGMKLFLGVYNVADGAYKTDLASMATQLNNDWSNVHTVSIGNELVNAGLQPGVVIAALNDAKSILANKGPKVVTVDTFVAVIANPALCQNSDYTAVNMHPFFDALTTAQTAGAFMTAQIERVRAACPSSQPLVITETGWPSAGQKLNLAIPGVSQQTTAINQIKSAVGSGYIMLSAFNDYWKNPGPQDIENYFGLYGEAPSDNATP